jgi:hypothetical protein
VKGEAAAAGGEALVGETVWVCWYAGEDNGADTVEFRWWPAHIFAYNEAAGTYQVSSGDLWIGGNGGG